MMHRSTNPSMARASSRSVLKTEYINWASDDLLDYPSSPRRFERAATNTNTAPIYGIENPGPPKRRCMPKRHSVHPYSRYMSDFALPSSRGSYSSGDMAARRIPGRHSSPTRAHCSPQSNDYWCASKSSRTYHQSGNSFVSRRASEVSPPSTSSAGSSVNGKSSRSSLPRTMHHGQAEQLRRSRESNTFALIDSQLSKSPLDKIREMYLQSKGVTTPVGSVPRTTKKANLSAVHTIVRFRIRDYLIELKDHCRRLSDQLGCSPASHKDLDAQLSSGPCPRDCNHCDRLQSRWDRSRVVRRSVPSNTAPIISAASAQPSQFHRHVRGSLHSQQTAQAGRTAPYCDLPSPTHDLPLSFHDRVDQEELDACTGRLEASPCPAFDQKLLSMCDYQMELPEEAVSVPRGKRQRLDSNLSRLCMELGFEEWNANSIELGPSPAEDPVDLQSLILDTGAFDMKAEPMSPSRHSASDDAIYSPTSGGTDSLLNGQEVFV